MLENIIKVTSTEINLRSTSIPFLTQTPPEGASIAVKVSRENQECGGFQMFTYGLPENHNGVLTIELRDSAEGYCLHDDARKVIEGINQAAQYQKAETATDFDLRGGSYPIGVRVYLRPEEKVQIEY
ncbi:hypothetical protein J4210_06170 [Candidatus Woesearchaeota archaeon]|nr:hypothetical protein [Candidatus Woesearchaeota archaeon]